jgi:hypothetical protein
MAEALEVNDNTTQTHERQPLQQGGDKPAQQKLQGRASLSERRQRGRPRACQVTNAATARMTAVTNHSRAVAPLFVYWKIPCSIMALLATGPLLRRLLAGFAS